MGKTMPYYEDDRSRGGLNSAKYDPVTGERIYSGTPYGPVRAVDMKGVPTWHTALMGFAAGMLRPWGRLCLYDPDGGRVLAHLMVYPYDGVREVAEGVGLCKSDAQKIIARLYESFPAMSILLRQNRTKAIGQKRRRMNERRSDDKRCARKSDTRKVKTQSRTHAGASGKRQTTMRGDYKKNKSHRQKNNGGGNS